MNLADSARRPEGRADFDPILLAVLSSRIESIIREMTNTVMKASRSSVIKNARDMSCGELSMAECARQRKFRLLGSTRIALLPLFSRITGPMPHP